jgi:hypothetical protein
MTNSRYGLIDQTLNQDQLQFPIKKLIVVSHKGEDLTVGYPAFGLNTYNKNLKSIGKSYSHPRTGEVISFRPSTTSESISAVAYDCGKMVRLPAFGIMRFQIGYIVRTKDGVFTNTTETDESKLKKLLNGAEKINGIYLTNNNVAFAPYESFTIGLQDVDTFVRDGLARALEHTPEKVAIKLMETTLPESYNRKVDVAYFNSVKDPILRVASLGHSYNINESFLNVCGGSWYSRYCGYAFGVLK